MSIFVKYDGKFASICLQCFLREKEKKWIWGRPLGREVCLFCKVVQKSGKMYVLK